MKKVTKYQSNDGKIHDTIELALENEKFNEFSVFYEKNKLNYVEYDISRSINMMKWLFKHRDVLLKFLHKYANTPPKEIEVRTIDGKVYSYELSREWDTVNDTDFDSNGEL